MLGHILGGVHLTAVNSAITSFRKFFRANIVDRLLSFHYGGRLSSKREQFFLIRRSPSWVRHFQLMGGLHACSLVTLRKNWSTVLDYPKRIWHLLPLQRILKGLIRGPRWLSVFPFSKILKRRSFELWTIMWWSSSDSHLRTIRSSRHRSGIPVHGEMDGFLADLRVERQENGSSILRRFQTD